MAVFVHLCHRNAVTAIRRSGLKIPKLRHAVYAMPYTPDYYLTHQWTREISRWRPGEMLAVTFRLPGETPVLFGHFRGPHTSGTADQAVAALMNGETKLGFETLVPRDVSPREILRIVPMRPITGWRYAPEAKGHEPCGCPVCQPPGLPFSRRLRQRYEVQQRSG